MKRLLFVYLSVALILPSCGGAPTPDADATAQAAMAAIRAPLPTNTPVQAPTGTLTSEAASPTPEPTPTLVPEELSPTSTPEASATPQPTLPAQPAATSTPGPVVVFRDDFDGILAAGWACQHED
jgi:hypothetical protein